MRNSSIPASRKPLGQDLDGACHTIVATIPTAQVALVVTFAGLASADNRVAEPNRIYPVSNGTEPEVLIRQMSAMGH